MGIGDIIHARRKELGLTLEQVGDVVGVTKNTVRQWENGNMHRTSQEANARMGGKVGGLRLLGKSENVNSSCMMIW